MYCQSSFQIFSKLWSEIIGTGNNFQQLKQRAKTVNNMIYC